MSNVRVRGADKRPISPSASMPEKISASASERCIASSASDASAPRKSSISSSASNTSAPESVTSAFSVVTPGTFTDNISELPLEMLLIIGLNVSLKDLTKLCSSSPRLRGLCSTEMFWKCRLTQDYPQYTPKELIGFSYQEYFQILHKVWNFQNQEGMNVIQPMVDQFGPTSLYLLYPVPLFHVSERRIWEADVRILNGTASIIIGTRRRKSIMGDIPLLGETLPQVKTPTNEDQKKIELLRKTGWDKVMVIDHRHLHRFLREAFQEGYAYYGLSAKLHQLSLQEVENNYDLFRFLPSKRLSGMRILGA